MKTARWLVIVHLENHRELFRLKLRLPVKLARWCQRRGYGTWTQT